MTKKEANKLVGFYVRVFRGGANPNRVGARVVEVKKRTAIVKPFRHGKLEEVRLADMREWKSVNEAKRERRRKRGT
jgi:hypothetical protein